MDAAKIPKLQDLLTGFLPPSITLKLAKKSIQVYSAEAGHDLSYRLVWP